VIKKGKAAVEKKMMGWLQMIHIILALEKKSDERWRGEWNGTERRAASISSAFRAL